MPSVQFRYRIINGNKMKRIAILGGMIMVLFTGCKPPVQQKEVQDETVRVRVRPVEYLEYKNPVRAVGMLGTMTEIKLSFKTGGIVREIRVKEGKRVRRGDVLAVLDLSEIRAQVDQAQIAFAKSGRDLTRAENLYRDSVATLEQYQNARSAYELARSQKQIAEFNLDHSKITAPADGKIQKLLVESNEMIAPGYPAILFASTENDWVVRAALIDKDIVKLSIGDSAIISMDAFPGARIRAEVTELGAISDPVTGTYEAELLILNSLQQFRTGYIATAMIYPSNIERSLVIPVESLLDASDQSAFVFTYLNGEIDRKRIETGQIINNMIVVLSGLSEGEFVVTDGVSYLREDSKVRLIDQP